ncbi:MAG: hypothetical protein P1V97_38590 [Planctomycetota bacterium]|nr:hypothetical protein [Planctomycetota bacterium]
MVRRLLWIAVAFFSLTMIACKEDYEDLGRTPTNGAKPSVPKEIKVEDSSKFGQVQKIFNTSCVTCHSAARPMGKLNLQAGAAYQSLVGRKSSQSALNLVVAGDLKGSYLIHKIRGTHIQVGGSGLQMPTPRGFQPSRMSGLDMKAIESWIEAGAPRN